MHCGPARCSTAASATCTGRLDAYSVMMVDYRITKRVDVYAGAMFSRVADGLAAGYLHTSTLDRTVGMRFRF
jgi:predicted porin